MSPPDAATDPYAALEHELRIIIRRAQSAAAQLAKRIHPELEASAYPLLAHISMHPGTRGSDLAAHFGIGRATVSRQLSRLVALGLVRREVDPEDTRGQRITLTEDGAARFERARAARVENLHEILAEWEREDITQLASLMHRYSESFVRWRDARS
ncbi:DNA-binding MarR family transcriptional regulator [Isoptericola variabilis J7]|uniref:Regulatory protein MarR n=2 Tax=Isoptericola TaxID=254250 RepID=F6FTH4_ISOV2|nr:regulatory protein MarR [Isoptericola variabilis 225]TWH35099.1 DNA-binding MarR family transcriptional regulator [Isoptericola variabilis J7]